MQLKAGTPGDRHDAGFTLIELLIAIVILSVIALSLGNVIISYVRNADATSDRLALSHDAQISAAYFASDVAAIGIRDYTVVGSTPLKASIQVNAPYNAGGATCGTAVTPTAVIRFLSDDWDTSGPSPVMVTEIVAYYLRPVGAVSELRRITCVDSVTPRSDVVLAHNVDQATVAVTCSSQCDGATVPQQVTLSFSATKPSVGAYPITLYGQRRQT
jgi:prepilin-type N-terminal cleavage/methylation domain-containing protein